MQGLGSSVNPANAAEPALNGRGEDETTASVLNAMSNAVAAASYTNGRLSPAMKEKAAAAAQSGGDDDAYPQPPPTPVLNPFASPPQPPGTAVKVSPNKGMPSSTLRPSSLSYATPAQSQANGDEAPPPLGSALLTQQLKHNSQLMQTDAIRAARQSWDAEHARDLAQVKRACAEAARADLMATEMKLVDIVGQLAEDYARMDEGHQKKLAQLDEKMGERFRVSNGVGLGGGGGGAA